MEPAYLVIAVLYSLMAVTASCPRGCNCMIQYSKHMTVCLKTNLTEIPSGEIPAATEDLHLRENKIRVLREGAFSRLTSLKTLQMSQCNIEVIEPNAFAGLADLSYLDLQYNKIKEIRSYAFSGLFNLKRLLLCANELETIHDFAFNGLNLTRLRLDNNTALSEISINAFKGAKINEVHIANSSLSDRSLVSLRSLANTLRKLDWQYNRRPLTIVPVDLFHGFHFQSLNLAYNGIQETSFLDFVTADELSLEGNPTGPIDFSHYPSMRQVRQLQLSKTGFNRLDGQYFSIMPHLAGLYLNENNIMSMPSNLETIYEKLSRLEINKNNIYCNCELLWFKRWLMHTNTFVLGARCSHPYLEDILFMDEDIMHCVAPKIISINKNLNVSHTSYVELNCVARGDPAPKITWNWPNGEKTVTTPSVDRNKTENRGRLVITSASLRDQGTYRCDAANIMGNVTASTRVHVYRVAYDHQIGGGTVLSSHTLNYCVVVLMMFALF